MDSSEVADIIEGNSNFTVEKDLTKGSKREDTLAYQISISIEELNEILKDNFELEEIASEDLFDEYMTLADELAMELEAYMPEDVIISAAWIERTCTRPCRTLHHTKRVAVKQTTDDVFNFHVISGNGNLTR